MPDPCIIGQIVLQDRGIVCAVTDRDLRVQQVSGAPTMIPSGAAWLGKSLMDLVPELIGSEDALRQILAGTLPRLEIPWVNRHDGAGNISYFTLVELPYRRDAKGCILGVIHVVQDMTEMGRLEQRLMQHRNDLRLVEKTQRDQNAQLLAANAELRRLDEAKSTFISVAAHELRTPLASITGYVEMLLDGDAGTLNARQTEYLGTVDASAQRLLRITRDLLDTARIQSGRLELLLQTIDLRDLLAEVAVEQMPQLEARSQRIRLTTANDLPPALVDPHRAAQVVGNLVSNASKYAPPGTSIALHLGEAVEEPGFLRVAVTDQGVGIPPEDQELLFRPFFRGTGAQITGAPGTGLGLYIARSLVELHGGRITLESKPGLGTTFFATFPTALGTSFPAHS